MSKIGDRLQERYTNREGNSPATRDDVNKLRREMDRNLQRGSRGQSSREVAGRTIRMAKRGFDNIGRSLNNPYDARRPKISQLPQRRRDIGITQGINLENLKMPGLRGQNISGRSESKKRR